MEKRMKMTTSPNQTDVMEKYSALCDAVKKRDKDAVRQLLLSNASVNPPKKSASTPARCPKTTVYNNPTKKFSFSTPLHWAILQYDDSEVLDMLLSKGADFSLKDFRRKTPLQVAVELNKRSLVESLLKNGAHVDEDLSALIIHSIEAGYKKLVELLVKHKLKVDGFINLEYAVDSAAEKGNLQLLKFFFTFNNYLGKKKLIPTNLILKNGSKYENCFQFLLQNDYSLNAKDKKNFSCTYKAVKKGCATIVDRFLKLGINVNKINRKTGLTFLHLACINDDIEMVKLLMNYKPDMKLNVLKTSTHDSNNSIDTKIKEAVGKTALFIAVNNLNVALIQLLHSNGANMNNDSDLLNKAIQRKSKEVIRMLLTLGANVNAPDDSGVTPLHYIIFDNLRSYEKRAFSLYLLPIFSSQPVDDFNHEHTKCSIIELFMSNGGNVNAQTFYKKKTPLHIAVHLGYENIVKVLLKYNANVTLTDSADCTPLHIAIENGNIDIIDIFLKHGVNPNITNSEGITLLHYACLKHKKTMIEKLIKYNASIHSVSVNGETPLHQVCRAWDLEIIQNLLLQCPNVNVRDKRNKTPFHILSEQDLSFCFVKCNLVTKFTEICADFKKLNADFNAKDSNGKTPLFYACSSGNIELVKILLNYNVKVNITDISGKTPLHVAALNQHHGLEIIKLLLEKKADATVIDKNGRTILYNAAKVNNHNLLELMYKLNININAQDKEGCTALHIATQNGSESIIDSLLKNGADIFIVNNVQTTALLIALQNFASAQDEIEEHRMYHSDSDNRLEYDSDHDYECYQRLFDIYERIIRKFKAHIVKLKIAGLYVDRQTVHVINSNLGNVQDIAENVEYDLSYERTCEQEIKKLKIEKIGHLSLCDILTKSINHIAKFTRNSNMIEALKSHYYNEIFPQYIDIIRNRFKQGTIRSKLLETIQICDLPEIFIGLPVLCTHEIFKYLNNEDLKTFVSLLKKS